MNNTRSDGKPAHEWVQGKDVGMGHGSMLCNHWLCKNCGVLKGPPQYPETACKGRVKVALR